jgi:filamentous hemagglutinin
MYANSKMAVYGLPQQTYLNQGLQGGLGLTPEQAAIGEVLLTGGAAAGPTIANGLRVGINGLGNIASETIGSVMSPYTVAGRSMTGQGIPAINAARADQILGGYIADEWGMTGLTVGSRVYGGLPGQSSYYTDAVTVEAAQGSRSILFNSLQVAPHPEFGYRPMIGEYEVMANIKIPFGTVRANPNYGVGGGNQYFIGDYLNNLKLVNKIPLGQ